ncbi:hypothetical protein ACIQNI_30520 [Streptomyces sp. NPDC091266]|uniref:hypothetical protein n=1 Tax=Streptomyces sp. NPDC091266 TaxID=3365978 RepID=UPI00381519B9
MIYPDGPLPGLPEQEALFEGAALTYARHRPGLPDAAVRLLADTLRGRPSRRCSTWAPEPDRCPSRSCPPTLT